MTYDQPKLTIEVSDAIPALLFGWLPYLVLYSCGHWSRLSSYSLSVAGDKTEPIDRFGSCTHCCINLIRSQTEWCNNCEAWVIHGIAPFHENDKYAVLRFLSENVAATRGGVSTDKTVEVFWANFVRDVCPHIPERRL